MAGAETVKKVKEGYPRTQGTGVGDKREIHNFLDTVRRQHCPAGLPTGHDILVIPENRKA